MTPEQVAQLIFRLGRSKGLSPARSIELVSAAFAESGLNPRSTNRSSGAAGLFQLLSPGYRSKAQSLGGLYNPRANTLAILNDYLSYWKAHPSALPGAAGRDVERSGQGAEFYARNIARARQLVGQNSPGLQAAATPPPAPTLTPGLDPSLMGTLGRMLFPGLPPLPMQTSVRTAKPLPRAGPTQVSAGGMPTIKGRLIGTPYAGTHRLGNWESDNAVDISVPQGSPIYAVSDGTIGSQIGSLGRGGRFAGLRVHLIGGGNEWYYAHLSRLLVRAGQRVRKGQIIGYSGAANGVQHLHFASKKGDPRRFT